MQDNCDCMHLFPMHMYAWLYMRHYINHSKVRWRVEFSVFFVGRSSTGMHAILFWAVLYGTLCMDNACMFVMHTCWK